MKTVANEPQGLWRSALCPQPASMSQIFDALKSNRGHACNPRSSKQGIFRAKIPLTNGQPNEGWEVIEFPGKAYLMICDCTFREDRSEHVPYEGLTELHYTLSGSVSVSDQTSQAAATDLSVFACRTGAQATYRVTCSEGPRRSLALYLHDDFLDSFLDYDNKDMLAIRNELDATDPTEVFFRSLPINRAVLDLVGHIINNPYADQRRLVYAEAKCSELILETLNLWHTQNTPSISRLVLKPRDIEMLEQARQLILQDLKTTPSIPQLARLVGTNTGKLTAGFKALFGTTIHQFTLKARMDHALRLLAQKGASVGEAAEAIGYQYQSSFTLAFTQHFHFLPSRAHAIAMQSGAAGNLAACAAETPEILKQRPASLFP